MAWIAQNHQYTREYRFSTAALAGFAIVGAWWRPKLKDVNFAYLARLWDGPWSTPQERIALPLRLSGLDLDMPDKCAWTVESSDRNRKVVWRNILEPKLAWRRGMQKITLNSQLMPALCKNGGPAWPASNNTTWSAIPCDHIIGVWKVPRKKFSQTKSVFL